VIDPYLGSGTTGVAAVLEGCDFSGCDLEERYVAIARERIEKLRLGLLKTRPLNRPIHVPSINDAVARVPSEWNSPLAR
jgi:adenine-specific DNA-methyltransferase